MTTKTAAPISTETCLAALALRVQATKLLAEAAKLDGMQPFLVDHSHREGVSVYVLWHRGEPDEQEIVDGLKLNFEPDREESIGVVAMALTEMTNDYSGELRQEMEHGDNESESDSAAPR